MRAEEPLPDGDFGPPHYCRIHHHLFQDVYAWAGQYRTVRISKGDTSFCYPEHIPAQMGGLFQKLQDADVFAGLAQEAFLDNLTPFLSELNAIHPFREGNGRTQLSFIGLLGEHSGHPFHFGRLDRETHLPAVVASHSDKLGPLRDQLRKLLT